MLLSPPSLDVFRIKEINITCLNLLWSEKLTKWRKEIVDCEMYHGSLNLHNVSLFDKTLKLSLPKRFHELNSMWTVFPNDVELEGAFRF